VLYKSPAFEIKKGKIFPHSHNQTGFTLSSIKPVHDIAGPQDLSIDGLWSMIRIPM
jgi:hypothetical protein